jgi:hypothetical protein
MFQNPTAKVKIIKSIQVNLKQKLLVVMICGMPGMEMVEM